MARGPSLIPDSDGFVGCFSFASFLFSKRKEDRAYITVMLAMRVMVVERPLTYLAALALLPQARRHETETHARAWRRNLLAGGG
jgi:hypothetical protein